MRLLMLPRYDRLGASSRLRMLQYVPQLQAQGFEVDVAPLLDDGYVSDLYAGRVSVAKVARAYLRRLRQIFTARHYDVVWVEKELWPWLPAPLELMGLPASTPVVADYDDAVFHRYDQHRSGIVRHLLGRKIDAVMRRADRVTAGNEYLAAHARTAGSPNVDWLPTVVDLECYPVHTQKSDTQEVVIGWIGSPATADYLQMLVPVLLELGYHHRIRCLAIGARPDQVQGTPFEAVEWHEVQEVALLGELDIGVMPLPDAPWERGKCGYKLIQYMACGLPVVASPVGVNDVIVTAGENGFLASNAEEWIDALQQLIADPELRNRMGRAGRRKVEDVYSLQAQAPRLAKILRDAAHKELG